MGEFSDGEAHEHITHHSLSRYLLGKYGFHRGEEKAWNHGILVSSRKGSRRCSTNVQEQLVDMKQDRQLYLCQYLQ